MNNWESINNQLFSHTWDCWLKLDWFEDLEGINGEWEDEGWIDDGEINKDELNWLLFWTIYMDRVQW